MNCYSYIVWVWCQKVWSPDLFREGLIQILNLKCHKSTFLEEFYTMFLLLKCCLLFCFWIALLLHKTWYWSQGVTVLLIAWGVCFERLDHNMSNADSKGPRILKAGINIIEPIKIENKDTRNKLIFFLKQNISVLVLCKNEFFC